MVGRFLFYWLSFVIHSFTHSFTFGQVQRIYHTSNYLDFLSAFVSLMHTRPPHRMSSQRKQLSLLYYLNWYRHHTVFVFCWTQPLCHTTVTANRTGRRFLPYRRFLWRHLTCWWATSAQAPHSKYQYGVPAVSKGPSLIGHLASVDVKQQRRRSVKRLN